MKTAKEAYDQHLRRIKKAIALKKTDRTPVLITTDSFCANHIDVKLSEFCANAELPGQPILDSLKQLGDVDTIDFCTSHSPTLRLKQLSGVKLQENTLYQIDRKGLMTE